MTVHGKKEVHDRRGREKMSRFLKLIVSLVLIVFILAGIGLIVLFRTNARLKENMTILLIMYVLSVMTGIVIHIILIPGF